MVQADTRRIEISSDSADDLEAGMRLAFGEELAKGFTIAEKDDVNGLHVLQFQASYTADQQFPCPLSAETCIDIALEWLRDVKYPANPGLGGQGKKGFIVTSGNLSGWTPYTLCAIEPAWMTYGK